MEENQFTIKDLNKLQEKYSRVTPLSDSMIRMLGYSDVPLMTLMRKKSYEYGHPSLVRYSYGFPYPGHDHSRNMVDTRVQEEIDSLDDLEEFAKELLSLEPPLSVEERVQDRIWKQDFEAATIALAYFNIKFHETPPYFLEEVFGFGYVIKGSIVWKHVNFKARQDGCPSKLFFAEIQKNDLVTFCCLLDETTCVRGCYFCCEDIAHPSDGGFLWGYTDPLRPPLGYTHPECFGPLHVV